MASSTHPPPAEEDELLSSPPMTQPVIPAPPQTLIPIPTSRPIITAPAQQPNQAPQQTIPTIGNKPAPSNQQRCRVQVPARPNRKPFLWGEEVNALGQGAFGAVILVHQTKETDLSGGGS